LLSVEQTLNGIIQWDETFGYDGFGNITSIDRNGQIFGYTYDSLNRVKDETSSQKSYHYDDLGNISEFVQNGQTYSYTYDNTSRVKQAIVPTGNYQYSYDSRGNRLTANSSSYSYNALNQLKTFSKPSGKANLVTTYTYYGDGLRATKSIKGALTRYVYLNGKVIEELDSSGLTTARNIWGNELLYREDKIGEKAGYYTFNGHGDVVKITDASGEELNSYDYDIWGNPTSMSESMTNPFKYSGEIYDDESGLIYLRARYYDPTIGRFITEDTYEGELNNPLSLNQYTYVLNNPLKYIDPTGNRAEANGGGTSPQSTVKWKSVSDLTPQEMGALLGNPNLSENDKAQILTSMFLSIFAPDGGESFVAKDASKYVRSFISSFLGKINVNVDNRKFAEYIFKEGATHGKDAVYRNLGYGKKHSDDLVKLYKKQALEKFAKGDYTLGKKDQYGQRINIEIELPGIGSKSGKTSYLKSGWMIREDGSLTLNTPFSGFTK
jgi:RHS repeat-associated protein